ncbi:MAG TPA: S8 family serine peptidase [Solirubrobacterales bacterium]|nr:S8 family serine peptidase [Solirubrobacterales bacterium]
MSSALTLRTFTRRLLMAAMLLALLLPVVGAKAAVLVPKDNGPLSPPLQRLANPVVRSQPAAQRAALLDVAANGPGSLVQEGGGVLVTARFAHGLAAHLDELRAAGAQIVSSSRQRQTVTLAVAPGRLTAIAAVPGVRAVWHVREPILYAEGTCEGGAVISEGLEQLRVDDAREAFELRGRGITVGVLSDSYDTAAGAATDAADDVVSGDLPGPAGTCAEQQLPVNVLDEGPAGEGDEGRAMLQIVHDLAPKAELAFATAFESEEGFAENIERLARPVSEGGAGADVIVDDVAWFEEPFFQDGPVAVAINRVTEDGKTYLSATGNDNTFDAGGNEISSWEAPAFRDSGACPTAVSSLSGFNGTHCMDFNPAAATDNAFGIAVEAGATLTVDLQWAEPWDGVLSDLDAFVLSGGSIVAAAYEENAGPTGTQRPVEILQWQNSSATSKTVQLVINRYSGLNPRLKFIFLQGGISAIEYPEPGGEDTAGPSIFGHAGAASAISVAAVPFNNSNAIEPYSSRGPVTHYFGPVEGTLPAAPLVTPDSIPKPDLAATDCGATTFFAFLSAGTWRFCGTSAAAPHAAAVAGLVRQAKPAFSEQEVRDSLIDGAVPVGAFPPEAAGAGLVDAFETIAGLPGPIEGGDGPSEPGPPLEPPGPSTRGTVHQVVMPPAEAPPVAAAPQTHILKRPRAVVRTRSRTARLVFRFGSDQPGATFLCKVDHAPYRACSSRFARRYGLGRHVVRVQARGAGGLLDRTPALIRFRVVSR